MRKGSDIDPKGLIFEAYRIDGIGIEECRSIFLDWALSAPAGADMQAMIGALLARHARDDHPMTRVLREGLEDAGQPRRRGGRNARLQ